MHRLTNRLGLSEYDREALLTEEDITTNQVKISLGQHIGAKAVSLVKKKELVHLGTVIAKAEDGKLSLPVHASISGEILEVNDNFIIIKAL